MRHALLAAAMVVAFSRPTAASETFCAVGEKTPDGFINLRVGPGPHYPVTDAVNPADFLYVGTERCRSDFGPLLCSEGVWLFVEDVKPFHGATRGKKGWINGRLIRQIECPAN